MSISYLYSSYKDPENRLVFEQGKIIRLFFRHSACNEIFSKKLLQELIDRNLIIPFSPLDVEQLNFYQNHFHKVVWAIEPLKLDLHLLPEQQAFSMWKEAALNYLTLNEFLINKGYILKDAPASNFCLHEGQMKLLDHGSFDFYSEGDAWKAYGQFCRNFLYPLWLMENKSIYFKNFFHAFPDGFPETFISKELNFRKKISLSYFLHVYLPYSKQKKLTNTAEIKNIRIPKKNIINIHRHLYNTIRSVDLKSSGKTWTNYYTNLKHYSDSDTEQKERFVLSCLEKIPRINKVLDIGCNTGRFSLLLKELASIIVSVDNDHDSVEILYNHLKKNRIKNIIPVHDSFSRPIPSYGWNSVERKNFVFSIKYDLCLFLAVYHHIRITDDIPANLIFNKLSELCKYLLIEYIPPDDKKITDINRTKQMNLEHFEQEYYNELNSFFKIINEIELSNSRKLYFCESIRR
jgi:SAM-dependent methyltransferase